jgi:bidirectional [NiFe] hydrogenase diaphorase subunit
MVKLTINNKVVEGEEGTTILDAAVKADIYIPTLCYHESLSPEGSCRLCLVEVTVKGINGLVTACTYPVEAGIEVKTDSERVAKARQLTMEMLLAQRSHSAKLEELARELTSQVLR